MKTSQRVFLLAFVMILTLVCLSGSLSASPTVRDGIGHLTRHLNFNFVEWTLDALFQKAIGASLKAESFLNGEEQANVLRTYVGMVDEVRMLENKLTRLVSTPGTEDPTAISEAKETLDVASAYLHSFSHVAESTLQKQTEQMLVSLGFGFGGQILPPVLYHVSELPLNLVISPREEIQAEYEISLKAGMDTLEKETLENTILETLDRSALITAVGGMGAYPTMVMRTSDLSWLADTVAHEWGHNWLTLHPLGMRYFENSQMKTINETTASILGGEVSLEVIKKWYPELAPVSVIEDTQTNGLTVPEQTEEVFNFRKEMRITRVRVDELLAKGQIETAEAYMETRRAFFWENGYYIRKINQAYFAFYGAYNDVPGGGASGSDPVGPAVQALRAQTASLFEFISKIQSVKSFQELTLLVAE